VTPQPATTRARAATPEVALLGAGAYDVAALLRGVPALGGVHVCDSGPPPDAVVVLCTDAVAPDVAAYAPGQPVVVVFGRVPADAEAMRVLREGATAVLVAGEFTRSDLLAAVLDARRGCAHLSPSAATVAVRAVRDPAPRRPAASLSPRERMLMDALAGGASNAAIAARLGLAVQTVRNRISVVYTKLGVHTRAEAVAWWLGGEGFNRTASTAYRVRPTGPR
jgi:DNA-binding NarL/FixJ family response regulator